MRTRLHPPPTFPPRDPVFASAEDFSADPPNSPIPSPPYRPTPSTSQLGLDQYSQNSPAYRSRINLMTDYETSRGAQEQPSASSSRRPSETDTNSKHQKPTVHYPANVNTGHTPTYFNSPPKIESRASSIAGTDEEEDEEDDYDWSGDEDLVDEETKFEKQMGLKLKPQGWGVKRIFTLLFSSLVGSTFLAGILVVPALLVRFYWYKPHPTEYRRNVTDNIEAWLFWAAANVVISWGLAMVIDIIPVVTRIFISIAWGHVSEEVKSQIELYDSVKDTIKPVLYAGSAWLSWIILFQNIFKLYNTSPDITSPAPYTDRVEQAIEFLFFFALVICAQRMLSHAIAFAFHRTAYKERLEEVKRALHAIEKLRDYKPKPSTRHHHQRSGGGHTPMFSALGFMTPFSEKEHFNLLSNRLRDESPGPLSGGDDGDDEDGGKTKNKKAKHINRRLKVSPKVDDSAGGTPTSEKHIGSPSGTPSHSPQDKHSPTHKYPPTPVRRRSIDPHDESDAAFVQAARAFKSAVLHDARNIKGKEDAMASLMFSVTSAHEAKRLARAIYKTFRDRRRAYLVPSDFYPAFPSRDEAKEAFRVFDRDDNGDISRSEVKATLLRVYKERRFLSRSMRDVGAALKTLNRLLLVFALIILFFVSMSIFGVNVTQSLTSVYSLGIAASFIFKNSASNIFDAIMFLFVTHPFDTGDRCFIDAENLIVKKMGLFATVFTRSDGTETYYFNSQLFTKFITNVRRSDKMVESLTMQVAWRTPLDKLDMLQKLLNDWLATEENRWFQPTTSVTLQHIDFQRHLELTITIPHNSTWQDWGLRNARRTAFHAAVQYYCRQLGVEAYESPIPIVYANQDAQRYLPPPFDSPINSNMPLAEQSRDEGPEAKYFLGFTPPHKQGANLSRARKSKSRKAALRGIGADGGDG
ncbi:Mechanosensitive ion channel-domain-containing protein [Hygrophoropsis aurantiaca]|uniref:Mechanosensitive ion channel-domain-containing protein n=1 Tax=Hygrophoropsis aurantiaca TaxID=72124 RepID=A0ACB8AUE5_9AGAM|nr:Mechanosensitive ion channel-domain-containing protein [Hygrophoropsis aurantiaca]